MDSNRGEEPASEAVILISSTTYFYLQQRQVTELDRLICSVSSGQIEDAGTREDEEEKPQRRFYLMVETSSLEREKKEAVGGMSRLRRLLTCAFWKC